MKPTKKIVLALSDSEDIHLAIFQYARPKQNWYFRRVKPNVLEVEEVVRSFCADGLIFTGGHSSMNDAISRMPIPHVSISGGAGILGQGQVGTDDRLIGRMGAQYFADKGFRAIAYFGPDDFEYCPGRLEGLLEVADEKGLETYVYDRNEAYPPAPIGYEIPEWCSPTMYNWLAWLPKPVGILACDDSRGGWITIFCHQLGLSVPEEVAVLGTENFKIHCLASYPQLSSIRLPLGSVGYEAARLLDTLMTGGKHPSTPRLFAPEGIVERASTDVIASNDLVVTHAIRFIRDNACRPICVSDVLEEVLVGRQTLNTRLGKVIGRTIFQEIRRIQIKEVRHLLRETNFRAKRISQQTGFASVAALSRAFRAHMGITMSQYRSQFLPPHR